MNTLRHIAISSFFVHLAFNITWANRPNIIVMMADDMGMGDTSAYQDFTGNADDVQIHTPNMERLARMGVRFTDAHTPSSRCTSTRYGLLTGRYPWRNRMKHWVLFGAQGDPMIEADRPTIASMLRDQGYRTAIVGKWHVGLRFRRSDGRPAAGWEDADITQPLHTSPLDHGFDFVRITSRSHGTSGPDAGAPNHPKNQGPNKRGPGHIHGRTVVGAVGRERQLVKDGPHAYFLTKLGSRHSNSVIEFLNRHVTDTEENQKPFFVYYPTNSNHGPYTPDDSIGGQRVAGAANTKSGATMDARHDFIYENDVALGRLLDWLAASDDPRKVGHNLIDNTLIIFTSDNGAEIKSKVATGPFRSNKGSVYEGGHRVPFLVSWKAGGVGDGDPSSAGRSNASLIGLQDLYATFAEIVDAKLPILASGEKGAEDSFSALAMFRGENMASRPWPMIFNDHRQASEDHAACAIRYDVPLRNEEFSAGQWKLFFDAALVRSGVARPYELYNLADDQRENNNLIEDPKLKTLIEFLSNQAQRHRNSGGHRNAFGSQDSIVFEWRSNRADSLASRFSGKSTDVSVSSGELVMTVHGRKLKASSRFTCDEHGLGLSQGKSVKVDSGESLEFKFNKNVFVESAAIAAGDGVCGGYYQVGDHSPLAIYCVDADNDAQDQHGILSDLGVLPVGKTLRLDSSPHYGVEATGEWQLMSLTVHVLETE